jgi:hypothetical protein
MFATLTGGRRSVPRPRLATAGVSLAAHVAVVVAHSTDVVAPVARG